MSRGTFSLVKWSCTNVFSLSIDIGVIFVKYHEKVVPSFPVEGCATAVFADCELCYYDYQRESVVDGTVSRTVTVFDGAAVCVRWLTSAGERSDTTTPWEAATTHVSTNSSK